jgi:DNA-binding response OmpR family regulator
MELILVVGDDRCTRRLVRDHLERAGYRVLTTADADSGWQMMGREAADLLILDLECSDHDGLTLVSQARADPHWKQIPILLLTSCGDEYENQLSLELGADDYVTWPYNPAEVVMRVRMLLHRDGEGRPQVRLSRGDLTLDQGGRRLIVRGEAVALTPTEFELLRMLMKNPGHVYTRRELFESTLPHSRNGTERTLDAHIRNIRRKIEPDPHHPAYIRTVHHVGYYFFHSLGRVENF